jgi:hypothetical protein
MGRTIYEATSISALSASARTWRGGRSERMADGRSVCRAPAAMPQNWPRPFCLSRPKTAIKAIDELPHPVGPSAGTGGYGGVGSAQLRSLACSNWKGPNYVA